MGAIISKSSKIITKVGKHLKYYTVLFGIIIISKITNLSTHPDSQLSAMDYINNLNTKYIKGNLEEHLLEFPPPIHLQSKL